jgi:hypothetical protein
LRTGWREFFARHLLSEFETSHEETEGAENPKRRF